MKKGWFEIPGVQQGDRTLAEQMLGVEPALAAAAGKTVCDLGCAEGLIALEFARAGAASVYGCDFNPPLVDEAIAQRDRAGLQKTVHFQVMNLNHLIASEYASVEIWNYDIVLALAILHKLGDPHEALRFMAHATRERLVIRLPVGSTGVIYTKNKGVRCDVTQMLRSLSLRLELQVEGPRKELVQHWVR